MFAVDNLFLITEKDAALTKLTVNWVRLVSLDIVIQEDLENTNIIECERDVLFVAVNAIAISLIYNKLE